MMILALLPALALTLVGCGDTSSQPDLGATYQDMAKAPTGG